MIIRLILFVAVFNCVVFGLYKGEVCTVERTSLPGVCKTIDDCPLVIKEIRRRRRYTRCGFEEQNEIVCCPDDVLRTTTTAAPEINENSPISLQKCKEYSEAVYETITAVQLVVDSEPFTTKVDKCGHKVIPLIVGGEEAKPKEFPHMALIGFVLDNNTVSWSCGGTLVSDQYVLTAGHCLHDRILGDPKNIRLGELNLARTDDDARPEDFNITEIIKHPEYKRNSKYNDIGLLKMDRKVKLNPYIRPACLPTLFDGPEKEAIATGWGHTEYAGKGSDHLLKVVLTKYTHSECNQSHAHTIDRHLIDGIRDETQICAGSRTEHRDACQGDSGGPLQVYHPFIHCMYTIIGITSFGIICGHVNLPAVYTRVFPYVGWIEQIVWGSNNFEHIFV